MEEIRFVIFYLRKELVEKLHKTVHTETERIQADFCDSHSKAEIMNKNSVSHGIIMQLFVS